MNKRSKIIYGISMIGLIILLYFSNSVIVHLDKINFKLRKSDMQKYESNSKVYSSLPWIKIYDNMLETIAITGIGGCETEFDNEDKKVKVLLSGEDITYEVDTNLLYSKDVNEQLNTKNIKGVLNGFSTEFSTLTMKNGRYKVYLYFWENEHNYGLTETDIVIEKTNKGLKQLYTQPVNAAEKAKFDDYGIQIDDNVKVVLWNGLNNRHNTEYYEIYGITYILGKDTAKQKVFVELTDSHGNKNIYPTLLTENEWMKENVGEEYINSYFTVRIATEDIKLEETTMRIIIENEGFYTSQDLFSYIVDDTESDFKQVFAQPVDNFKNVNIEDNMYFALWSDIVDDSDNAYYTVSGIAYISGKDSSNQEVYIELEGASQGKKTYQALLLDNSWMKENLGEQYSHGEFNVKIAKEDVPSEDVKMRIIINNDGVFTNRQVITYRFDREKNMFIKAE